MMPAMRSAGAWKMSKCVSECVCVWHVCKDLKLWRCLAICDLYNFYIVQGAQGHSGRLGPMKTLPACHVNVPAQQQARTQALVPPLGASKSQLGGTGNFRPLICYRCWFVPSSLMWLCFFFHPLLISRIRCCMLGFSFQRITEMIPVLTSVCVCVPSE